MTNAGSRPTRPNSKRTRHDATHSISIERQHGRKLMKLARAEGFVRAADATARGIPRVYLRRLVAEGKLEQIARGIYRPAGVAPTSPHQGLALVALKSPRCVVSLLSAWITLPSKARVPRLDWPSIRVGRASGAALTSGIEHKTIDGVVVRIYSPAKTVADCFKHRNKIGLDVALEALRAYRPFRAVQHPGLGVA